MKRVYIAAYHQSKFGKLLGMTVPEIVKNSIEGVCREINADPSLLDVGAVGAACNISLNEQGLVSGLAAAVPGLAGKPIESVENACASGGQAVLSTILKLQAGWGETGFAMGYEKMRDAEGKMDGKLIGKALGVYSHPDERAGKTYIFPHLFAEIMDCYIKRHKVTEADLATIAVEEYANGNKNPIAQMNKVKVTLDDATEDRGRESLHRRWLAAEDLRLLADHRWLRGHDSGDRRRTGEAGRQQGGRGGDRRLRPGHRPAAQGRTRRFASRRSLCGRCSAPMRWPDSRRRT